jgi:hypothetical protein
MEVAAVAGLVGLGYAVSRLAKTGTPKEGFQDGYGIFKPGSKTVANRGPPNKPLANTPQGASVVGSAPELDLQYALPNGQTLPSTPNPTPYGLPTNYATQKYSAPEIALPPYGKPLGYNTQKAPLAPNAIGGSTGGGSGYNLGPSSSKGQLASSSVDANPRFSASPAGYYDADSKIPQIKMNNDYQENPTYVKGNITSALSGEEIPASEFKHNNMVPFFGGRVKQNMRATQNTNLLDTFTGAGDTQITKKEVEQMFDTSKAPYGNPYGLESATDFIESRINTPWKRNNETPMEKIRVAPGVGEKGGLLGNGGFQQLEINEIMRPRTTDQLRVATNPKTTYDQPLVPGAHFVGSAADNAGEVRKYRPDRFFTDESNSRVIPGPGAVVAEAVRPVQVLPETTRTETSTEIFGAAAGQDTFQSYTSGAYRTPMGQQYGGAGFRNADMSSYFTKNTDSPEADYGRGSWENRPNERATTSKRTMALNISPAESGTVPVHYTDDARPTRRAEMESGTGSGEVGHAVAYASSAPAATVWDPQDIARTTVKQTTIVLDRYGVVGSASQPNKLKVYDPNDIARPTQKAIYSNRSYTGGGYEPNHGILNEDYAYNMRTNPNKEQIAKGRKPIAGSGQVATFNDQVNQTARRLVADDVNIRVNAKNRVEGLPPGAGDLGQVKYRVPLHLDVSAERLTPDIVSAVNTNPLMQSLEANAKMDAMRLASLRQAGIQ